jgi:hypothetical protein
VSNRSIGVTSLVIAAAIPMFIILFGIAGAAGLSQTAGEPAGVVGFFRDHRPLLGAIFVNSIVMHVAVIVLAVAMYARFAGNGAVVAATGAALGIAWAVLDMAQSSITYSATLAAPTADPATIDAIAKGLQNAGHLGGGLWLLTLVAIGGAPFSRTLRAAGLVVGTVFGLHVLVVPVLPAWWTLEYIGLPVFFGWTAIAFFRGPPVGRGIEVAPAIS